MTNIKLQGCFSHNTDDWKTPSSLYNKYMECNYIDCFPYNSNYDQFNIIYKSQKLFVNPPYSKLKEVTEWIYKNVAANCIIHLLIPARTDTKYFNKLLKLYPTIYFIKGRLKFNDSKNSAPFPSIIMIFWKFSFTPLYQGITLEEFINRIV